MTNNESFIQKANAYKRPLKEKKVYPTDIVEFQEDCNVFQNLKAVSVDDFKLPYKLAAGDKVLLDFGDHYVGYLHFALDHYGEIKITDAPVHLKFSFGEFPLEIVKPEEEYVGKLGKGWIQREEKKIVFTPYSGTLERRYAFRYLLIERLDNAIFPVAISDIYAATVSAVDMADAPQLEIADEKLKKIYDISLKTLKECEQDVFEDGPKRDRRLWIGDLRLQALTDYTSFKNYDLIKRCIYLFAGHRAEHNMVAPCVFPDSPPYIDEWTFVDYSLFFIPVLYDYFENCRDLEMVEELYDVALEQAEIVSTHFNSDTGEIDLGPFIDWCPELDKSVAIIAVYIYTLKQLRVLAKALGKAAEWMDSEIIKMKNLLLRFYSEKEKLFVAASGQISWHSQVWAVLSGVLTEEENIALLERTQEADPAFIMHTPYMIHYYIEALYSCGLKEKAMEMIKEYWGKIIDSGFDCCPEIFNPENEFESPYSAPEINSACHAWSCTPAYWIYKYYHE